MLNKNRLIFVLLCVLCLVSCGDTSVSEEISFSEEVSVTETVTTVTAVQTTQAASESVIVPVTTAENVNETADIEVPENAVYKQTITSNNSRGFFERIVNIFDEKDNKLINAVYTSENDESPTSWTIYTYDTDGKLIKEDFYFNDSLLHYIEYEYDENGFMISDTEYSYLYNGEVHEVRTEYIYDDKGRLSAEQAYQNDHQSWRIEYEYDEQDRLIKDNYYSRINSYRSYSYDENGNLSEKTDDGEFGITVTYYTYDEDNRPVSAEEYHEGELMYTYEYEYEEL